MFLTSCGSDPLEDLSSEGLSGDGSDDVASVLLFADIADPLKEDVLFLGHVDVAFFPSLESSECVFKVRFDLVSVCHGVVKLRGQCLDLLCLQLGLIITGMSQLTSPVNSSLQFGIELTLNRRVVLSYPSPESSLKLVLQPVNDCLLENTTLLILDTSVLQPGVESSSILHLHHTTHVIGKHFLRQVLRLCHNGDLA